MHSAAPTRVVRAGAGGAAAAGAADPFANGNDSWSQFRANSQAPPTFPGPPGMPQPSTGGSGAGGQGASGSREKWRLYDEKLILGGCGKYDSKNPEVLLQDVHDYIAGRTQEIDQLLVWVEIQNEEITASRAASYGGCLDSAPISEISRQLWAFLGTLVKEDAAKASVFRNVPRHNGLESGGVSPSRSTRTRAPSARSSSR